MKLPTVLLLVGIAGLVFGGGTLAARVGGPEVQTTQWANGSLRTRTELRSGRPEGRSESWYPDGSKQSQGEYRDGRMEGEWHFWRPDGSLDPERTATYRAGLRE